MHIRKVYRKSNNSGNDSPSLYLNNFEVDTEINEENNRRLNAIMDRWIIF